MGLQSIGHCSSLSPAEDMHWTSTSHKQYCRMSIKMCTLHCCLHTEKPEKSEEFPEQRGRQGVL
ncbi:uncharacterized protein LOC144927721 isoform X7 [Branchiostoma floridae x Branchiostoma belcheri]